MASEKGTDDPARIIRRAASADPEIKNYQPVDLSEKRKGLADLVYCIAEAAEEPGRVFDRLRWGGQAIVICPSHNEAVRLSEGFEKSGFDLTDRPSQLRRKFLGIPFPLFSKIIHYFIAQKLNSFHPAKRRIGSLIMFISRAAPKKANILS